MPRLHRELVRELISEITTGERAEGESLPRETDLAERFEVSRGVARESLRALEERGLVRVKHGRGATVCPTSEWNLFDGEVMAGTMAGPHAAPAVAASVECLRIVECEAAGLAAQRASSEDLAALSQAVEQLDQAAQRDAANAAADRRARTAELDFHRALMRATKNPPLARIGEPLHEALADASRNRGATREATVRRRGDYKRVLEAVADRDPDAARATMRRCLDALARELRAQPGKADPS